jgi:hypothetical protein
MNKIWIDTERFPTFTGKLFGAKIIFILWVSSYEYVLYCFMVSFACGFTACGEIFIAQGPMEMFIRREISSSFNLFIFFLKCWHTKSYVAGVCRSGGACLKHEMAKWRNGTTDKSQRGIRVYVRVNHYNCWEVTTVKSVIFRLTWALFRLTVVIFRVLNTPAAACSIQFNKTSFPVHAFQRLFQRRLISFIWCIKFTLGLKHSPDKTRAKIFLKPVDKFYSSQFHSINIARHLLSVGVVTVSIVEFWSDNVMFLSSFSVYDIWFSKNADTVKNNAFPPSNWELW